ncbi:hypothetical protein VNO78_33262 [Psophocarpus tetragonolobus]|uniref:SANT domain-containing protein n=1 Tax=Psophocarpus tetragonolobus TaxID=3891 RepID=A0AAN9NWM0_PSOTE
MAPKPISRDKKSFFNDKKRERYGSPTKQDSSHDCDFSKFQHQRSTKFRQRLGSEPLAASGVRHKFLEEPRSGSVSRSYGMTSWNQNHFFNDKKHEMYKHPSGQYSSFHCNFPELRHQRSTLFQRAGSEALALGVGGARHRFLEEPRHNSVLRSYEMPLCDRNDIFNKKKHEKYGSLPRHQDSSFHSSFLQGSNMFQQHGGSKTLDNGGGRHRFPEEPIPISRSHSLTSWDRNEFLEKKKHERYLSASKQQDPSSHYSSRKFKQQGSTLLHNVGSGTRSGGASKHHFPEEHGHGSSSRSRSRSVTLREDRRRPSIPRPSSVSFRSPRDPRRRFWGNASTTSSRLPSKRPIHQASDTHYHARSASTSNKSSRKEQSHEDPLAWKSFRKGNHYGKFYKRFTEKDGESRSVEKKVNEGSEETRKRPRLNWGEGLAKFEKKKTAEVGASDVVAAAHTPTSAACNSLSGASDTLCVNTAIVAVDNDVGNLGASFDPVSQNHQQIFSLNSQRIDANTLSSLSSSVTELLESVKARSVDSSLAKSNAINKLQLWKNVIAKVVEATETEIDSLENELKLLQSESGDGLPCLEAAGSLMVCHSAKSSDEDVGGFNKVTCPETLQIVPYSEVNVEKMLLSTNLAGMHDNSKEDDVNIIPGTVSPCDATKNGTCLQDMNGIQLTAEKSLVPYTNEKIAGESSPMEIKDGIDAHSIITSFYSSTDNTFHNTIIASNREAAERASAEFDELSPKECGMICNVGDKRSSESHNNALLMNRLEEKRRYEKFKEKVLSYKYKAFNHLWKTDLCLQSLKKSPTTSHRNLGSNLQTMSKGCQKNRSSIHNRFNFPDGNQLSLVPTFDIMNYTSNLLSEPKNEDNRSMLKMPALILDPKEKKISMFASTNGRVEDPVAEEKERAMINPWTSEEKKIFTDKFAAFGKDFHKIASFLDHKTTAECVNFYYKIYKPDCLEKGKKKKGGKSKKLGATKRNMKTSSKKRNLKVNVDSHKSLSKAPVLAIGSESYRTTRSGRILLWNDPRVSDATEALITLSSKAVSSFTKTSVDPVEAVRDKTLVELRPQCEQSMAIQDINGITATSVDPVEAVRDKTLVELRPQCEQSMAIQDINGITTTSVDPVEAVRDKTLEEMRPQCEQSMAIQDINGITATSVDPVEAVRDNTPLELRHQNEQSETIHDVDGTASDKSCRQRDSADLTNKDKEAFLQAVSSFGEDFALISEHVGSRSENQCKMFSQKRQKSPTHHRSEENVTAENGVCGGRSDNKDHACVVEIDTGKDSCTTKTNFNNIAEPPSIQARNLSLLDLNEPQLVVNNESKLDSDDVGDVLFSSDKSSPVMDKDPRTVTTPDISCSSSATKLPPLSQKMEETRDHLKALLSESENSATYSVVFKLFGKLITFPSSTQKADFSAKGNESNGTHQSG